MLLQRIFSILLLITFLMPVQALAHSPYTHKIKTIKTENGQELLVEKVFGDGILFTDPGAIQVRNRHGAVIGISSPGTSIGYLCFSVSACYAFTDSRYGLSFAERYVDDSAAHDEQPQGGKPGDLHAYMTDPALTSISGWDYNIEPGLRSQSLRFEKANPFLILLSPAAFFVSYAKPLLTVFILMLLGLYLKHRAEVRAEAILPLQKFMHVLLGFAATAVFLTSGLGMLMMVFYSGVPILHMAAAALLAFCISRKFSRKTTA